MVAGALTMALVTSFLDGKKHNGTIVNSSNWVF